MGIKRDLEDAEKAESLIVGQFYSVNSVIRLIDDAIIPVHGPLHEDAEIIKYPYDHWHIDWRFINKRLYQDYFDRGGRFLMPWAWPINANQTTGVVQRRRMQCKRQFEQYAPVKLVPWLKRLEEKYSNARMKNFICPHKGLPCNATPVDGNTVICRGHGLAFDVETGELIRQVA
jgi:hypothetical protein